MLLVWSSRRRSVPGRGRNRRNARVRQPTLNNAPFCQIACTQLTRIMPFNKTRIRLVRADEYVHAYRVMFIFIGKTSFSMRTCVFWETCFLFFSIKKIKCKFLDSIKLISKLLFYYDNAFWRETVYNNTMRK